VIPYFNISAPKIPPETDFISTNSTTLRMNMFTWEDLGCPIIQYVIEYKQLGSIHWIRVDSQHNDDMMYITDLISATWFQLKISAANEAGTTMANYNFATTTISGGIMSKLVIQFHYDAF
jgi:Down syndrome cell adhesion molecule